MLWYALTCVCADLSTYAVCTLTNSHTKHVHTGQSSVKAAFLVDPVDNTRETPESVDYPSAAKALKSANRPVGIAGASVITGCNPAGSNWEVLGFHKHLLHHAVPHHPLYCILCPSCMQASKSGAGYALTLIAVCAGLAHRGTTNVTWLQLHNSTNDTATRCRKCQFTILVLDAVNYPSSC